MVSVIEKRIKGTPYLYLVKSVRVKDKVLKISKLLGKKSEVSKEKTALAMKQFTLDLEQKVVSAVVKEAQNRYGPFTYPFTLEEVRKIEEMNLKYKELRKSLKKKDWEDMTKRFVANFVFESNALEGNSLTLKNFSEIVFENKISASADLREVYDAQNSFKVFSRLLTSRQPITEQLILTLHKNLMKNIDDRTGYKQFPNVILGRKLDLTKPEHVHKEINGLLQWLQEQQNIQYPLSLAFQFHHRFEKIHPFADGNGRVGRMLLNYILLRSGYYPLVIRKNQREKYLRALQAADQEQFVPLLRFALEKMKDTSRKFFEVYYQYL